MRAMLLLVLLSLPACDTTDDNRDYVEPDAAPAKTCRTEYGCRASGLCSGELYFCKATSEADCLASNGCKFGGACALDATQGKCVITADGCRNSLNCANVELRACYPDPRGVCVR